MIETYCTCGAALKSAERDAHQARLCSRCGATARFICGEQLPDGAGAADFDVCLTIQLAPPGGPAVGQQLFLGGVADVTVGKLADRNVQLIGQRVSRAHCSFQRLDFGPSRWRVVDNHSTNGLFVNGTRVTEFELHDGDVVKIGDYHLGVRAIAEPVVTAGQPASAAGTLTGGAAEAGSAVGFAPARSTSGGHTCPSCEKSLASKAKICIDCGIHVPSGRPLLTTHGLDEDTVEVNTRNVVQFLSYVIWVTPLPIPIASEAFGTKKPYAIWTIAALTCLFSLAFLIYSRSGEDNDEHVTFVTPGQNLMLWSPQAKQLMAEQAGDFRKRLTELRDKSHNRELAQELSNARIDEIVKDRVASVGEFHPYQLITHAFLHDTSSIKGFAMHLGGNLLFLIVFGGRVNALLGNLATAIIYPILALGAATAQLFMDPSPGPMLGASGAIMGLAGMYLILFPVHRVFCAMWIRIGRWPDMYGMQVFALRGFWVLAIYFAYDVLMNFVEKHLLHSAGGVAHWAHIGGFTSGFAVALTLLFSRLANARGGDMLSVALGRHAWALIGKPCRRMAVATNAPMAPPVPGLAVTRYPV